VTITVGIIARNARPTIRTAVRSALRDRHVARVVVWDDGSDDGTTDALVDLRGPRLVLAGTPDNRGIPASRNALLALVETPHLAWLDADDVCLPWRFASQLRTLDAGYDIAFTPVIEWLHRTPLVRPQLVEPLTPRAAPFHLLIGNPFMNPTMLTRTSVLHELGGYRDVASEDYDLWLRAATARMRLHRSARPTVVYRRHAAQTTQQQAWRASRGANTLVEDAFGRLADETFGFVPSWFRWLRAGRPANAVPETLVEDAARFDRATGFLHPRERRPILRLTRRLRRDAGA
jgi:hypothetical protein